MKKKSLPIMLALAALSASAFVGCANQGEAEHTYEWKYDGDVHWQECECGDKTQAAAHIDEKNNLTGESGVDGLCDVCGKSLHVHVFEWNSDTVTHWEECSCGEKKEVTAHIDVKNNETDVDEFDLLCDICGRQATVVFDMQGHGFAPAAQYIGIGELVEEPDRPSDDDAFKFAGWYEDAAGTTLFDFSSKRIEDVTTVYAKWNEDTTPGASKKYAITLENGVENLQNIQNGDMIYFKYTAGNTDGRYTLSLGAGINSQKCKFTTDAADGEYGYGCDSDTVYFDLDAGRTAYVLLTCDEQLVDGARAGILLEDCIDEPLPEGKFLSGEYANGTYSFVFDREQMTVLYNENNYSAKYVGGKFDTLSFVQSLNLGGDTYETTFSLTPNADGNFDLAIVSADLGTNVSATLFYTVPQDPIAFENVVGKYVLKPGSDGNIDEFYVYNTCAVIVKIGNNYSTYNGVYDDTKNKLSFAQYTLNIKLNDDGDVSGGNLTGGGISGVVEYVRIGDVGNQPPESLALDNSAEYVGEEYVIRTFYGSQYFGATGYVSIFVLDYDEDSGMYSVSVDGVPYKITIDGNTVKLYSATAELLDTLTKFEWTYHDLPTVQSELTAAADGFQKNLYLYKVRRDGWYKFTYNNTAANDNKIFIYSNVSEYDPTDLGYARVVTSGDLVFLAADSIVGVYAKTPIDVVFGVTLGEAPEGTASDNPKLLEDGSATFDSPVSGTYYFRYTAPKAGKYIVSVAYESINWDGERASSTTLSYTVNGKTYGYDPISWGYVGGKPEASIEVSADNLVLEITVECTRDDWLAITVGVEAEVEKPIEITAASGTLESGWYVLADNGAESIALTSDTAFTIVCGEDTQTGNSFTLTAAQAADGFKLQGNAKYTVAYKLGTANNPIPVSAAGTVNVKEDYYVTVTAPANKTAVVTLGSVGEGEDLTKFCIEFGGLHYGYYYDDMTWEWIEQEAGTSLTIPAGQSATFKVHNESDWAWDGDIPLTVAFNDIQAEAITLTDGTAKLQLSWDEIKYITLPAGAYKFIDPNMGITVYVNGVLLDRGAVAEIADGDLIAINGGYFGGTLTISEVEYMFTAEQAGTYVGTGAVFDSPEKATLVFDRFGVGTFTMSAGTFAITMTKSGDKYAFTYADDCYSAAITFDGNNVVLSDDEMTWFDASFTMEKQAVVAPVQTFTFTGVDDNTGRTITFVVAEDYSSARYTVVQDGDTSVDETVTITEKDGTYSFAYSDYGEITQVTFTVNGDTLVFVDEYYTTLMDFPATVLTKQE